jgi:hypothetical protein
MMGSEKVTLFVVFSYEFFTQVSGQIPTEVLPPFRWVMMI